MIGTGPFKFQGDWVPNDHLTVVKNPNYWRKDSFGQQLPYLDQITFKPVPDPTAMLNGLKSKAFDLANTDDTTTVIPQLLPAVSSKSHQPGRRDRQPGDRVHDLQHVEGAVQQHPRPEGVRVRVRLRPSTTSSARTTSTSVSDGPFGPGVLGYVADYRPAELQPRDGEVAREAVQDGDRPEPLVHAQHPQRRGLAAERSRGGRHDAEGAA